MKQVSERVGEAIKNIEGDKNYGQEQIIKRLDMIYLKVIKNSKKNLMNGEKWCRKK